MIATYALLQNDGENKLIKAISSTIHTLRKDLKKLSVISLFTWFWNNDSYKSQMSSNLQKYIYLIIYLKKFISFKQNVLFEMLSSFCVSCSKCKTMHCSQLKWFSVTIFFGSLSFIQFWIRICDFPARS